MSPLGGTDAREGNTPLGRCRWARSRYPQPHSRSNAMDGRASSCRLAVLAAVAISRMAVLAAVTISSMYVLAAVTISSMYVLAAIAISRMAVLAAVAISHMAVAFQWYVL